MEKGSSLNSSIDNAKRHYSSLFSLPSLKKALLGVAVECFLIGLFSFAAYPSGGLVGAAVLGVSFFVLTFVADLIVSEVLLRGEEIYNLRRSSAMSLVGLGFWIAFVLVGLGLSFPFGWLLWVKVSLLGYGAVITLRIIVVIATSTAASWRRGLSVLLQPTFCLGAFALFWSGISGGIWLQVVPFVVVSPIICFVAVMVFFSSLERFSKGLNSLGSLPLFRAFIINWVTDLNAPLEAFLEEMGEDAEVGVTLLKFGSSKPKAAIILPQVHPGPFKNIGSSVLPSLLKLDFEKEVGCDACVPLGILGHELDLCSQAQNMKIVSQVIASSDFNASAAVASPCVKVAEGFATASCQVFGDTAFLSFTLAPKTTEDLPQALGRMVEQEAEKYGLKHAVVVNAHNSLTNVIDSDEHLNELHVAASKCLQKAVAQPTEPFMVGAASIFPKEFSLKAGMGKGGITAIVVGVGKQKTVYVIIDGNNMVPGLREKILGALLSSGFDEGEVFTTDTHAVSAIVTGKRGYHPVGEVMDNQVLIERICEVAKRAEVNLELCNAGCLSFVVPKVRVIGEERLRSVTLLIDKAVTKAKQIVVPIFGLEGLFLVLLVAALIH